MQMARLGWREKILVLAAVPLAASLLFQLLVILPDVRAREVQEARLRYLGVAEGVGRELDRNLEWLHAALVKLAAAQDVRSMDPVRQEVALKNGLAAAPAVRTLSVVHLDGRVAAAAAVDGEAARVTVTPADDNFRLSIEAGAPFYGRARLTTDGRLVTTRLFVPVLSDAGAPVAAVVGELLLKEIASYVAAYPVVDGATAYLLDSQHRIVAFSGMSPEAAPLLSIARVSAPLLMPFVSGQITEGEYVVDGVAYFGSSVTLDRNQWLVVVIAPLDAVLAESRAFVNEMVIANLIVFVPLMVIALLVGRRVAGQQRMAEERLRRSNDELRTLGIHLQLAREEERAAVALELHDETAQGLSALKMDLWQLGETAGDGQEFRRILDRMSALVDAIVDRLRRVYERLSPLMLGDLGLAATLQWRAEQFATRTGTICVLDGLDGACELQDERALALFRFFEQALEALGRGAPDSDVRAALGCGEECVTLRLWREGEASARALHEWTQSLAFAAVRERIQALGGRLEFGVDGAAVCTATLPTAERAVDGAQAG